MSKEVDEYGFYTGKDLKGDPSNISNVWVVAVMVLVGVALYFMLRPELSETKNITETQVALKASNQITIAACKGLGKFINSTNDMNEMSKAMSEYVSNDCDSRIGEPTRAKRLQEIRDAF